MSYESLYIYVYIYIYLSLYICIVGPYNIDCPILLRPVDELWMSYKSAYMCIYIYMSQYICIVGPCNVDLPYIVEACGCVIDEL